MFEFFVVLFTFIFGGTYSTERPEEPVIMRDVAMADASDFSYPHIPPLRTSADGRIGIRVEGNEGMGGLQRFHLLVPEKMNESVMTGPNGATILSDMTPYLGGVDVNPVDENGNIVQLDHTTLCDVRADLVPEGKQSNPYSCGANGQNDCYDLTLIGAETKTLNTARMWGTKVRVEIENPKTANAQIYDIQKGDSVAGPRIPAPHLFEPMVTWDGRLFVGRRVALSSPLHTWINPNNGIAITQTYDLMYSVMDKNSDACDVRNWKDFHPVSHAHFDPEVKGEYGFAEYQIRDSEGNYILDGVDFGASYPWMDRDGNNLFFTTHSKRIVDTPKGMYPHRCVNNNCDQETLENLSNHRGHAVVGLWTQGKTIVMDNLLNNTDWAIPLDYEKHMMVELYQDDNQQPIEVRVGGGRELLRDEDPALPPGWSGNTNVLDSIENLFNFRKELKPVTPRDVVWVMSNGRATDEFSFDDYLDPNAFIISNMSASSTPIDTSGIINRMRYNDGGTALPTNTYKIDMHVQNAAAALPERWRIPAYGLVKAGTARIEPVALGGITGRGFWLNGESRITYNIPWQHRNIRDHDWYVGLFIDPRFDNDNQERTLIRFSDRSALSLIGRHSLVFRNARGVAEHVTQFSTPLNEKAWHHLGVALSNSNRSVQLLVDGLQLDQFESSAALFEMKTGELQLGSASWSDHEGMRGWIDEFKVLAYIPNQEVMCNHAHGTLIGIDDNEQWQTKADQYPAATHIQLSHVLAGNGPSDTTSYQTYDSYACYADYTDDYAAHLGNIPIGTTGLRDALVFPEGPLISSAPRLDSSNNAFCLSCHTNDSPEGLSIESLKIDHQITAPYDPRRQPLQPINKVYGNIPAGWIEEGPGAGGPLEDTSSAQGEWIDYWVLPETR